MIDEILAEIFGQAAFGRLAPSRRTQLLVRLFFGLLGAALGILGAVHFGSWPDLAANTALRLSIVSTFVSLASFCLFNVGLGRPWRWPGKFFVLSFVAVFATRILFGR